MKTTDSLIKGSLKPEYYDAFARYLVKYVDAMAAEGVDIFALTLQNEPHFEPGDYPGMRLEPAARAAVIGSTWARCWKRASSRPRSSSGTTTGTIPRRRWLCSTTRWPSATSRAWAGTATPVT
jgi:hypothetical protein